MGEQGTTKPSPRFPGTVQYGRKDETGCRKRSMTHEPEQKSSIQKIGWFTASCLLVSNI